MELIKRLSKDSKLTIKELDDNLKYIESLCVGIIKQDNNLLFSRSTNTQISLVLKGETYLKKIPIPNLNGSEIYYKGVEYLNFNTPTKSIQIRYNKDLENKEGVSLDIGKSCKLIANLGYWVNSIYSVSNFTISLTANPNFILDNYIIQDGGFDALINSTIVQSDGKIISTGYFTKYNGISGNSSYIIRLNTDGTVDRTFGVTIKTFNSNSQIPGPGLFINSGQINLGLFPDDKILLVSNAFWYDGVRMTMRNSLNGLIMVRLNSDGSFDSTFNNNIAEGDIFFQSITYAINPDGSLIILNYTQWPNFNLYKLNYDGTRDLTFNSSLQFNNSEIVLQSDGKIILINRNNNPGTIIRLNSDGTIDLTFNTGTGFNNYTRSVGIQSDGKLIVSGRFTSYNGTIAKNIVRLNSDGTIDLTFNSGTGFSESNISIYSIMQQDNGKILICGEIMNYGNSYYNNTQINSNMIRLNSNGTRDLTFIFTSDKEYVDQNPSYTTGNIIRDIIKIDNMILVVCNFGYFPGTGIFFKVESLFGSILPKSTSSTVYTHQTDTNTTFTLEEYFSPFRLLLKCNESIEKVVIDYTLIEY
jgi:uncharacterized delta-60 repeat protein